MTARQQYPKYPFLGRGIGFPLRRDPITGGMQVTEGSADPTVGLEYVSEQFTIREDRGDLSNHIREALMHIIMTRQGEHDTLPEFGSRSLQMINLPNKVLTQQVFETYCEVATERWEKRVNIKAPDDFEWHPTPDGIDHNNLPVTVRPELIGSQVEQNLVAPFVTTRQARAQEYPLGQADENGHDWMSRYHGMQAYMDGDVQFIREPVPPPLPIRSDDRYYQVRHGDTWLLIAHRLWGDGRFWWVIFEMFVQDAAGRGESREAMDPCGDPDAGTLLRYPSESRLLMEILG